MRRALTWLAGAIGVAALARLRARRRAGATGGHGPGEVDPAEELRQKLADRKDETVAVAPAEAQELVEAEPAEEPPADLDARRAEVHARAQEAIDLMRDDEGADTPGDDSVA